MDDRTRQNWEKVKLALEAAGKTDCHFYARAVSIVRTGRDIGTLNSLAKLDKNPFSHD